MTNVLIGGRRLDPSVVRRFERTFGLAVPRSLKALVADHDGARVRGGYVAVRTAGGCEVASFDALYAFAPDEGEDGMSEVRLGLADAHPGYLVFGYSADGDQVAFDMRDGAAEPPVVSIQRGVPYGSGVVRLGPDLARTLASMTTLDAAEAACEATDPDEGRAGPR